MSIKTCIYELIRIELSCGDMREIIFSQDFLQYIMCQYSAVKYRCIVQRKLSSCYIDLSDFSSAALSSIAVATATPHFSALQLKKSSCVNIAET